MALPRVFAAPRSLRGFSLALFLLVSAGLAGAQEKIEIPSVETLLQSGGQLESQQRWGDALAHFEDALRNYPKDVQLERRRLWASMHVDLGRRYGDATFRDLAGKLASDDALALYAEVLLKIQSHYVDAPEWRSLVNRGTVGFEIALSDEIFLQRYLPETPAADINTFRSELREKLAAMPVRTRLETRDAVHTAAWLANQRLGLPAVPVIMEYTCGMTNTLDDYTAFLPPKELADTYAQIDGNFVGLGVELKGTAQGLKVLRVIGRSPADRAGLRVSDLITAVDGQSALDMNHEQAADKLQGPEGTSAQITVVSPGQEARSLTIRREHVDVPSIDEAQIVDPALGVAYFRLSTFQKSTLRELDETLWKLHGKGMKHLIVDLRGNPGGLLSAAVDVSDKFLETGTIVSTRGRNTAEDMTYRAQAGGTWHVPLILLIDGDSASASEIFAGAVRDNKRGVIVGQRSYGKGSVQGIFSLRVADSGIRLTTSKFFSPLGKPFTKVGVEPDVAVQQAAKPVDGQVAAAEPPTSSAEDPYLRAALEVIRNKTARRDENGSR
ncbi:MAG: S41 family peptidase [Planctomycetia bacterium]|nr:S41 family peptidase [Planctomycetia bacterium]